MGEEDIIKLYEENPHLQENGISLDKFKEDMSDPETAKAITSALEKYNKKRSGQDVEAESEQPQQEAQQAEQPEQEQTVNEQTIDEVTTPKEEAPVEEEQAQPPQGPNDEFIEALWDNTYKKQGMSMEDFKSNMASPTFRKYYHEQMKMAENGISLEKFENDLGYGEIKEGPTKEEESQHPLDLGPLNGTVVGGLIQFGADLLEVAGPLAVAPGAALEKEFYENDNLAASAVFGGLAQGVGLAEGMKALRKGEKLTDEQIDKMMEVQKFSQALSEKGLSHKFVKDGAGSMDAAELTQVFVGTALESGVGMVIGAIDSFQDWQAGSTQVATLATNPVLGMAANSAMMEMAGMLHGEMQSELQARELEPTRENIRTLLENEDWLNSVRKKAATKGAVVGAFDLVAGKIAFKAGAKIADDLLENGVKTLKGKAKSQLKNVGRVGTAFAVEGTGGAAGEVLGTAAAGDEITKETLREAQLEFFGEAPSAVVSVGTGFFTEGGKAAVSKVVNSAKTGDYPAYSRGMRDLASKTEKAVFEKEIRKREADGDISNEQAEFLIESYDTYKTSEIDRKGPGAFDLANPGRGTLASVVGPIRKGDAETTMRNMPAVALGTSREAFNAKLDMLEGNAIITEEQKSDLQKLYDDVKEKDAAIPSDIVNLDQREEIAQKMLDRDFIEDEIEQTQKLDDAFAEEKAQKLEELEARREKINQDIAEARKKNWATEASLQLRNRNVEKSGFEKLRQRIVDEVQKTRSLTDPATTIGRYKPAVQTQQGQEDTDEQQTPPDEKTSMEEGIRVNGLYTRATEIDDSGTVRVIEGPEGDPKIVSDPLQKRRNAKRADKIIERGIEEGKSSDDIAGDLNASGLLLGKAAQNVPTKAYIDARRNNEIGTLEEIFSQEPQTTESQATQIDESEQTRDDQIVRDNYVPLEDREFSANLDNGEQVTAKVGEDGQLYAVTKTGKLSKNPINRNNPAYSQLARQLPSSVAVEDRAVTQEDANNAVQAVKDNKKQLEDTGIFSDTATTEPTTNQRARKATHLLKNQGVTSFARWARKAGLNVPYAKDLPKGTTLEQYINDNAETIIEESNQEALTNLDDKYAEVFPKEAARNVGSPIARKTRNKGESAYTRTDKDSPSKAAQKEIYRGQAQGVSVVRALNNAEAAKREVSGDPNAVLTDKDLPPVLSKEQRAEIIDLYNERKRLVRDRNNIQDRLKYGEGLLSDTDYANRMRERMSSTQAMSNSLFERFGVETEVISKEEALKKMREENRNLVFSKRGTVTPDTTLPAPPKKIMKEIRKLADSLDFVVAPTTNKDYFVYVDNLTGTVYVNYTYPDAGNIDPKEIIQSILDINNVESISELKNKYDEVYDYIPLAVEKGNQYSTSDILITINEYDENTIITKAKPGFAKKYEGTIDNFEFMLNNFLDPEDLPGSIEHLNTIVKASETGNLTISDEVLTKSITYLAELIDKNEIASESVKMSDNERIIRYEQIFFLSNALNAKTVGGDIDPFFIIYDFLPKVSRFKSFDIRGYKHLLFIRLHNSIEKQAENISESQLSILINEFNNYFLSDPRPVVSDEQIIMRQSIFASEILKNVRVSKSFIDFHFNTYLTNEDFNEVSRKLPLYPSYLVTGGRMQISDAVELAKSIEESVEFSKLDEEEALAKRIQLQGLVLGALQNDDNTESQVIDFLKSPDNIQRYGITWKRVFGELGPGRGLKNLLLDGMYPKIKDIQDTEGNTLNDVTPLYTANILVRPSDFIEYFLSVIPPTEYTKRKIRKQMNNAEILYGDDYSKQIEYVKEIFEYAVPNGHLPPESFMESIDGYSLNKSEYESFLEIGLSGYFDEDGTPLYDSEFSDSVSRFKDMFKTAAAFSSRLENINEILSEDLFVDYYYMKDEMPPVEQFLSNPYLSEESVLRYIDAFGWSDVSRYFNMSTKFYMNNADNIFDSELFYHNKNVSTETLNEIARELSNELKPSDTSISRFHSMGSVGLADNIQVRHYFPLYTGHSLRDIASYWSKIWSQRKSITESALSHNIADRSHNIENRVGQGYLVFNKDVTSFNVYSPGDNYSYSRDVDSANISNYKYATRDTALTDPNEIKKSAERKRQGHDEWLLQSNPSSIESLNLIADPSWFSDNDILDSLQDIQQQDSGSDALNSAYKILEDTFGEEMIKVHKNFGVPLTVVDKYDDVLFKVAGKRTPIRFQLGDNVTKGFYDKASGKAFLVDGNYDQTTTIHEAFGHPFLEQLKVDNPELYNNLLEEAKALPDIVEFVDSTYPENERNDEYILAALDKYTKNELDAVEHKGLIKAIKDFIRQMSSALKQILNIETTVAELPLNLTLQDLSQYALYGEGKIKLMENDIANTDNVDAMRDEINELKKQDADLLSKLSEASSEELPKLANQLSAVRQRIDELNEAIESTQESKINELEDTIEETQAEKRSEAAKKAAETRKKNKQKEELKEKRSKAREDSKDFLTKSIPNRGERKDMENYDGAVISLFEYQFGALPKTEKIEILQDHGIQVSPNTYEALANEYSHPMQALEALADGSPTLMVRISESIDLQEIKDRTISDPYQKELRESAEAEAERTRNFKCE